MRELHEWFQQNRRPFPWRGHPTPYKVWISEVMLQQTRASVVVPYFLEWMELFPDVWALARAPLEQVIKMWEGLGYYSRARNLHWGAQQVVREFGGEIPSNREDLEKICGLGPYTVGAILSFGFRQRAVAVDGNVTRVVARYFSIEENVCRAAGKRRVMEGAERLLDEREPWVTAEGLIELGATVCTPKPRCEACPLQKGCRGKAIAESLPIKNGERETIQIKRAVAVIESQGRFLVKKGEAGKVMADLYEFPYFEMEEIWPVRQVVKEIEKVFGFKVVETKKMGRVSHTFTRYKADLYPLRCQAVEPRAVEGFEWVDEERMRELPFSSGHRRILRG